MLTGLTLTPASTTLTAAGATQQLTATATYSNGTTQNVTSNAATTYKSNNTAVATAVFSRTQLSHRTEFPADKVFDQYAIWHSRFCPHQRLIWHMGSAF